jgi:hypothetical protein
MEGVPGMTTEPQIADALETTAARPTMAAVPVAALDRAAPTFQARTPEWAS